MSAAPNAASLAHAELDRLRHLADTSPRRTLAYVANLPTERVRQLLLLALSKETP